jgi:hypothetical protein
VCTEPLTEEKKKGAFSSMQNDSPVHFVLQKTEHRSQLNNG